MKKNPFTKKLKSMTDLKNVKPNKQQRIPKAPLPSPIKTFNIHSLNKGDR